MKESEPTVSVDSAGASVEAPSAETLRERHRATAIIVKAAQRALQMQDGAGPKPSAFMLLIDVLVEVSGIPRAPAPAARRRCPDCDRGRTHDFDDTLIACSSCDGTGTVEASDAQD